jgi:spoIIIJ-associated protein
MEVVVKSAKTIEEAVRLALIELGCQKEDVDINVLEEPTKGFLGLLGGRDAKVEVSKKNAAEAKPNMRVVEARRTIVSLQPEEKDSKPAMDIKAENVSQGQAGYQEDHLVSFLEEVTALMGVPSEVVREETDDVIKYTLSGNHMGTLIGRRGDTLDALQYLTNVVSNKGHHAHNKRIILDSEGYRQRREETLNRLAKRLAARVKRTGHKVILEPMSPMERRLIHTALQDDPAVKTLSEGEEPYRRLVISPANGTGERISREDRKTDKKDYSYPKKTKTSQYTYNSERRFSERPPKRSYTNVEDVDGKSESDLSEGKSSLW